MAHSSLLTDHSQSQSSPPLPPPSLARFFCFLKAAFAVTDEGATAHTLTQHKIVEDRDRYLPFRQLGPSKRIILADPNGPFSSNRLKTQAGFFDALLFRLITQASPILVQEKQVCFGSPQKFKEATEEREKKHYCHPTATGQHSRFLNIPHIPDYWKHASDWNDHINCADITLESLLTWLGGSVGNKKRFFGIGNLVGWLLASDYVYAGLVKMPEVSEVGEIIFKINAGGKHGLQLLGFNVDTKEACGEAMVSVWTAVHKFFTPAEIEEMGLDPITLEHALCKFKRLQPSITQVG